MGDQTASRPLHRLIEAQVDIMRIRAALVANGASALPLIMNFYRQWIHAQHAPNL
jgi:hypothetical protein